MHISKENQGLEQASRKFIVTQDRLTSVQRTLNSSVWSNLNSLSLIQQL